MNTPSSNKVLIWIAVITQIGLFASTWITHEQRSEKLDQIHGLVNSRLTQALDKIQNLEDKLGLPRSEPKLPEK